LPLIAFTKMEGAGNDFVVLDATRAPLPHCSTSPPSALKMR